MKFESLRPRQIFKIGDSVGMVVDDPFGLGHAYVDWHTGSVCEIDPCTDVELLDNVSPVLGFNVPNPLDEDDCYPHLY